MTNTTLRILIVVFFVGLLAGSTYVMPQWMQPKNVLLPDWDLAEMPLQFGSWQGVEKELDPKVTRALNADRTVDREYRHAKYPVVALHVAFFCNLDEGVRHSPINCYRGQGWQEIDRTSVNLRVPDKPAIPVSLTTWEQDGERVLVMYWFQLDEHIILDRSGLAKARWKMRNKETWPALAKVLLQSPVADEDKTREGMLAIATKAYEWLNQTAHQPTSGSPAG